MCLITDTEHKLDKPDENILKLIEDLSVEVFRACLGIEIPVPFPRLSYDEAMLRFGNLLTAAACELRREIVVDPFLIPPFDR